MAIAEAEAHITEFVRRLFQTLQHIPCQNAPALLGVHEGADVPPPDQPANAILLAHGGQPPPHKHQEPVDEVVPPG